MGDGPRERVGIPPSWARLSRRALLSAGACSLALGPTRAAAQAASLGQTPRPSDQKPIVAKSDENQHLTIDVRINALGPFRFVVDTGADRSVLADDVAAKVGLLTSDQLMVEGIVRTIPADAVLIRALEFGSILRENLEVPVLPRALLGADGYLGLDAIDGYCVTFDFLHEELRIEKPNSPSGMEFVSSNSVRMPAPGPSGHLRSLNCDVDGVRATAFIDSGAQVTIGNPQLAAALLDRDVEKHVNIASLPITGVTGGRLQGQVTSIGRIRLKSITFAAEAIVIADLQVFELWRLSQTPAVLIGMNYLRKFAQVSVDYRFKEFRFELADRTLKGYA